MKKYIILLTAVFIFPISTFAQAPDITVDWGDLMKSKDSDFQFIIGSDDTHYYTYGYEKNSFGIFAMQGDAVLKKYNRENFKVEKTIMVESFEYKGKEAVFKSAYLQEGTIHLYFEVYQNKMDRKYLVLKSIDPEGRIGKAVEVSEVNAEKRKEGGFSIINSQDSSKFMVHIDVPTEKKENERFKVIVFNRAHEQLWEKEVELPYTDKHFTIGDKALANNGEVFMLAYATPDKDKGEKKQRKESNQYHKLFSITPEKDIIEFDLGLQDKFVNSASINTDFKNNTMAVSGFYSDKSFGEIGGSFFITIGQDDLTVKSASSEPFTVEFLKNFMSERKAEKGRELGKFVFRDLVMRGDGGAVLVAEQHYEYTVVTSTPNGGTTTTTYYVYNDIIAINVNPDGSIAWAAHIPKEQKTANDGGFYLSYFLLVEGDRLHFIYNDHRKNLERIAEGKDVRSVGNLRKSVSIVATIEGNGRVSFDELFRNKDFSAILVPKLCIKTSDDQGIMYGIKGNKTRFGALTFN